MSARGGTRNDMLWGCGFACVEECVAKATAVRNPEKPGVAIWIRARRFDRREILGAAERRPQLCRDDNVT
jgi:hypothetical protein